MKNLRYYIVVVFWLFQFQASNAQQKKEELHTNDVLLEGVVTAGMPGQQFEVIVHIATFPANITTAPSVKYVVAADSNNYFRLIIPSPADRFYMYLRFAPNGSTFIDNIYLLEKGDRLSCKLSNGNFQFAGRGSSKLNCQNALYKIKYSPIVEYIKLAAAKQWPRAIERYHHQLDSILRLRLSVLSSFAASLGPEITEIMEANCYGLRYFSSLRALRGINDPDRFSAFVNSAAYRNIDRSIEKRVRPEVLVASPNYTDFLFEYQMIENLKYENEHSIGKEERLERLYHKIKSDFSGLLREKLLTIFLLRHKDSNGLSFADDALNIINTERYRLTLEDLRQSKEIGGRFYPFELQDDQGKTVKLSDLDQKVVLVDFWFTGCGPCQALNTSMKPVIAEFEQNPNVKFVSVNVDSDKAKWLKSVASGDYTHPTTINLHIGEDGVFAGKVHPLLTNYNITSYPTLFLLKNGRIFNAGPPKPSKEDTNDPGGGNTKKLIDLIKRALK